MALNTYLTHLLPYSSHQSTESNHQNNNNSLTQRCLASNYLNQNQNNTATTTNNFNNNNINLNLNLNLNLNTTTAIGHNFHHHHHHNHQNHFRNYQSLANKEWRGKSRAQLQSRQLVNYVSSPSSSSNQLLLNNSSSSSSSSSLSNGLSSIQSLLDLSAKVVAENIPFHHIEAKYEHIPEPVQRRVIFWSFPPNEDDIKIYSSLSTDPQTRPTLPLHVQPAQPLHNQHQAANLAPDVTNQTQSFQTNSMTTQITTTTSSKIQQHKQLTYYKGHTLCNEGFVQDVLQVGFSLSGIVNVEQQQQTIPASGKMVNNQSSHQTNTNDNSTTNQTSADNNSPFLKSYRVSVTFDRCKITSVSCTCDFQDIFWCEHVVALILYRIRNPETIDLRVPISETLLTLDRQQLQKLVQYIIAEHHIEVLPTAQRLLDEITQSSESTINKYQGAPDPTAGSVDDVLLWHLNEQQVYDKTKRYLDLICSNSNKEASKHVFALFDKIKEMFCARDTNGTRLLKLITEQFLQYATRSDNKCRPLWDQLVSLWVVVIVNPDISKSNRQNFIQLLTNWSRLSKCPLEDVDRVIYKRKASTLTDEEEIEDTQSNILFNRNLALAVYNQGNNYPAHMATHRHRTYQPSVNYPVLKPFNQIPVLAPPCTCHNQQLPSAKRLKLSTESSSSSSSSIYCSRSRGPRPSASSSSSHQARSNNNNAENRSHLQEVPRSIFQRAIDINETSWDDHHLQFILNNDGPVDPETSKLNLFDYAGYPLWNESLSQSAARVLTLKCHGYKEQALRLTVATIRRLKLLQSQLRSCNDSVYDFGCISKSVSHVESWIGHPFDPTNVLFDALLEASTTPTINTSPSILDNHQSRYCPAKLPHAYNAAISNLASNPLSAAIFSDLAQSAYMNQRFDFSAIQASQSRVSSRRAFGPTAAQVNADKISYYHVPIPGCCNTQESYLSLAVELAVMALGQQRPMPILQTAHDRSVRQEAELISKLDNIDTSSDSRLIEILKNQTTMLLEGGPFPNSCCCNITESAPLHTFARYLFDSLVLQHSQLAYGIGVYALKIPLTQEEIGAENYAAARSRSTNNAHLQAEQLSLAQTMLTKAKEESHNCLRKVYKASVKNIRNAASLLKLSRHSLKEAKPNGQTMYPNLLKTSFDLGLQVLKVTMAPHTSNIKIRREAISFIVECVTELDLENVVQLMKDWKEYFTPIEAVELIVGANSQTNLKNQASSKFKLKEDLETELYCRSRDLVLECATRDSTNCALDALKFCETDEESLKRALDIVIDAGVSGSMDSTQLIRVADHVHERGLTERAFELALVAVESLVIPSNVENSAAKKDIFRACEFAREIHGFSSLIPKLIENVECAAVLSEIYHTFKPTNPVSLAPDYRRFNQENTNNNQYLYGYPNYNEALNFQKNSYDLCKQRLQDNYWWDLLLKKAIKAFDTTTRSRLVNISPRHYGEFIDFLVKAQTTFEKATDGPHQFKLLIVDIMKSYKTKKKLMERLKTRFDLFTD